MDEALQLKAEQLAGDIAAQAQTLDDLNGLIRTLMKSALERMLDTEMDAHLGRKALAAPPQDQSASPGPPAPATHCQLTHRRMAESTEPVILVLHDDTLPVSAELSDRCCSRRRGAAQFAVAITRHNRLWQKTRLGGTGRAYASQ